MFKITQNEADALRENNMGRFITITNKTHGSKAKTYYMVEDRRARDFIDLYRKERNRT